VIELRDVTVTVPATGLDSEARALLSDVNLTLT
jgi:hypothetical protein